MSQVNCKRSLYSSQKLIVFLSGYSVCGVLPFVLVLHLLSSLSSKEFFNPSLFFGDYIEERADSIHFNIFPLGYGNEATRGKPESACVS